MIDKSDRNWSERLAAVGKEADGGELTTTGRFAPLYQAVSRYGTTQPAFHELFMDIMAALHALDLMDNRHRALLKVAHRLEVELHKRAVFECVACRCWHQFKESDQIGFQSEVRCPSCQKKADDERLAELINQYGPGAPETKGEKA